MVTLKGLSNYKSDASLVAGENLCKRGHSVYNITLPKLPHERALPPKKIIDLRKLLETEFNKDWPSDPVLAWFQRVIGNEEHLVNQGPTDTPENDEEAEACNCLDEDCLLSNLI